MTDDKKSVYSSTWDAYVTEDFPRIQAGHPRRAADLHSWQVLNTSDAAYSWPGDEWGDAALVQRILGTCIHDYLGQDGGSARFCELGSGAGRFTSALLQAYPSCSIDCFDISQEFLNQMQRRFADEISADQLATYLITDSPRSIYKELHQAGRVREIDCVFSFDAMVHVELHSILIYIATAAAVLKPGGLLAMSVADAASPHGFQKLLFNAPGVFQLGGRAGAHFQFMSADILRMLLETLGFSCELHNCNERDLFFSARLIDTHAAKEAFRGAGSGWSLEE